MFIKNDNISLRCAEPEDAPLIYKWENDRSVWRVSNNQAPYSLFQIEQFLLSNNDLFSNKQLRLMIDNPQSLSVGCIDLFNFDAVNQHAEVGLLIDSAFRHQGYAKESLQLLLEYTFNNLMLHQLFCSVDEKNIESQQVFLHLGFEKCGHRKQWIKTPEGFLDVIYFQYINNKP